MRSDDLQDREVELGLREPGEYGQHVDRLVLRGPAHADAVVAHVSEIADDCEAAHWTRDLLLLAALRAIADGAAEPADLAARALKADDVEFSRWYA